MKIRVSGEQMPNENAGTAVTELLRPTVRGMRMERRERQ
jgi:hypothetical protein